jgi:transposase-like protein
MPEKIYKRRPNSPPEVKAAIFQHLLAGKGIKETARELDVHFGTVLDVKRRLTVEQAAMIAARRSESFEERLTDALEKGIEALATQFEVAGSKTYLESLAGDELALLHSVTFDRVVQLLSAAQTAARVGQQNAGTEPPTIDIPAVYPEGQPEI